MPPAAIAHEVYTARGRNGSRPPHPVRGQCSTLPPGHAPRRAIAQSIAVKSARPHGLYGILHGIVVPKDEAAGTAAVRRVAQKDACPKKTVRQAGKSLPEGRQECQPHSV